MKDMVDRDWGKILKSFLLWGLFFIVTFGAIGFYFGGPEGAGYMITLLMIGAPLVKICIVLARNQHRFVDWSRTGCFFLVVVAIAAAIIIKYWWLWLIAAAVILAGILLFRATKSRLSP